MSACLLSAGVWAWTLRTDRHMAVRAWRYSRANCDQGWVICHAPRLASQDSARTCCARKVWTECSSRTAPISIHPRSHRSAPLADILFSTSPMAANYIARSAFQAATCEA